MPNQFRDTSQPIGEERAKREHERKRSITFVTVIVVVAIVMIVGAVVLAFGPGSQWYKDHHPAPTSTNTTTPVQQQT